MSNLSASSNKASANKKVKSPSGKERAALRAWTKANRTRSQQMAELRYGKGNSSLMEWAKNQTSLGAALECNASIFGDSFDDYDGFFREDSDSMAMYLAFTQVGEYIANAMINYSENND